MSLLARLSTRVRHLEPGSFAAVMATGIVSIDAAEHGWPRLALALLALNSVLYVVLLALCGWRALAYRRAVLADFMHPSRGAGFLTLAAGTCVLASQCLEVLGALGAAMLLTAWGAVLWLLLIYLFFVAAITARIKPGFTRSIHGGWLVAVVATQSLAVSITLLAARLHDPERLMFLGLCLYMLGAALYLLIITLIVYRMVFFPLRAREFTPPYWINMGALAITTLAGSLLVLHAPAQGPLHSLVPFVLGFTVFFWATASWWIPLLLILEAWRHLKRRVPLRYETDAWDIVFPIGMYTVGTWQLAHALAADYLLPIAAVGVYINLLVWLLVALAAVQRGWRNRRAPA
ncbi:MAG TPA: tellurite resistance/C4-dicarboxylate transporter family protein [Rhodanobacteraceae bacterium]|nr:tellurite resistance/C4-dicarboxylate transporter family protein [Rhodanobacteraceae bacterium]